MLKSLGVFGFLVLGSIGAYTVSVKHQAEENVSSAVVDFTDTGAEINGPTFLKDGTVIKHEPEKYWGSVIEDKYEASGPPVQDNYPRHPDTYH